MSTLEQIVRPFQSGDVFTARVAIPTLPASGVQLSTDDCTLTWGKGNPGDYDDIPSDLVLSTFQAEWKEDASQRVVEKVRVEQPDNPDNYVEVERMKEAVFKDSVTGKTQKLKFAPWS